MSGTWRSRLPKIGANTLKVLAWVLVWAGLTLLAAGIDIRVVWGDINVDQMLTNMTGAAGEGGGGLVGQAVWWIGVVPLLVTILLFVGRLVFKRMRKNRKNRTAAPEYRRRPAYRAVAPTIATVLVAGIAVTGTGAFSSAVGLPKYIQSVSSKQNLGQYYQQPALANPDAKGKKNNMVVIYLESSEKDLGDTSMFEKNVYSDLEKSTKDWASIDDYQQYDGGGWTMSGMVSTQCGIPLRGKSAGGDSKALNNVDANGASYLGGLTCYGDLLKKQGYTSEYIGGAGAEFAAKGLFYKTHGYDTVKDLHTWESMGEKSKDIRPDWGLSDKRLMSHAKDEVTSMHDESDKTGKPFNLSMITLDSHEPVHVYDSCKVDTKDQLNSVWACSMKQVAGFIDYMKAKGYLKDTSVMVMGDHLKHMGAKDAYHEQLDDKQDRSIFNRIWVPGTKNGKTPLGKPRGSVDQLNMLPTMLDMAGVPAKDRQAGMGVSAFSPQIPKNSAQALNPDQYEDLLGSRSSDFYKQAWAGSTKYGPGSNPTPSATQSTGGATPSNDKKGLTGDTTDGQ